LRICSTRSALSWTSEALQVDVSQGLALALIALIAVLPEYAVNVTFAWKAGAGAPWSGRPAILRSAGCSSSI
jgi:hypothetical protein